MTLDKGTEFFILLINNPFSSYISSFLNASEIPTTQALNNMWILHKLP